MFASDVNFAADSRSKIKFFNTTYKTLYNVKSVTAVYSSANCMKNSLFLAASFLSTVIEIPGTFSVSAGRSKDGSNAAVLYDFTSATT